MAALFDGVLFPQSLQDLVKGIRAHRRDEAAYIRGKIVEITAECRSSEPHKKANGVLKLTYVRFPPPFSLWVVLPLPGAASTFGRRSRHGRGRGGKGRGGCALSGEAASCSGRDALRPPGVCVCVCARVRAGTDA